MPGVDAGLVVNMTTLGLIGSGRIGSTVARLAVDAGHDVVLSNSRGPETLADLVAELGPRARAGSGAEAAAAGDLVLVSTPLSAYASLPAAALDGKTVLDTGNYYPQRDGQIAPLDAGELTGRIEPGKSLDFVDEIAAVLPIRVAVVLIGLPPGHDADIRRWSDALESMKLVRGADNIRATVRQFAEMSEFFQAQFTVKRANPGDDLISTLLAAQLDGKPLSEPDLLTYCSTFLAAGSDTTRSLLAGMALALAEHPDQLSKLKANPDLLEGAIEESLRWTTPARGFLRTALADTQVRGVDIKAGQRVYLLYDAGNRDAEVFADPWTYDIERPNAHAHLGFGYGPHLCIAAHLARLEARELYGALLDRYDTIKVTGEVIEIRQLLRNGWVHLPLSFS